MSEFEKKLNRIIFNGVTVRDEKFYLYSNLVSFFKDWQPPMPLPKPYIEVPKFVADWFEEKMSGTFSAVIKSYSFDYNEATAWVHDNGGFNLLCKMKLYGYTVEKEQLYVIKYPMTISPYVLCTNENEDNEIIISGYTTIKKYAKKFTESEIKAIDERYWQFAVEVNQ